MTKKTVTIHAYTRTDEHSQPGNICVFDSDFRGNVQCMKGMAWICQQDVEIEIPEINHVQAQIESLEDQVVAERVSSVERINLLVERIGKLKAIGHEVAE